MIYFAATLSQFKDAIEAMIEIHGPNAPVGRELTIDGKIYLDNDVQIEWVCINKETRLIVGDEAEDYELRLKPNEMNAVLVR